MSTLDGYFNVNVLTDLTIDIQVIKTYHTYQQNFSQLMLL